MMKNRHRVFIAINLPGKLKKRLANYESKWPDLPAKWTKEDNLHITLDFLGPISSEELGDVLEETRESVKDLKPFEITLDKVVYGPIGKSPRMIWAVGPKIEQLNLIPHITLARINKWEWKKIEVDERPVIEEDTDITFSVDCIDVMESVLKKGGPEYTILESIPLSS